MSHPASDLSNGDDSDIEIQTSSRIEKEERIYERKYKETKYKLKLLKNSYSLLQKQLEEARRTILRLNSRKILLLTELEVAETTSFIEERPVKPPKKRLPSVDAEYTPYPKKQSLEKIKKALAPPSSRKTFCQGAPLAQSRDAILMPRENDGSYILPLTIGKFTVLDLGTINYENKLFHNKRYIWPVGFTIQRSYYSTVHAEKQATYTATVLNEGGAPVYKITASDNNIPITGKTASGVWATLICKANKARGLERKNTASGPDYYGITDPTIAKMIQDLPNAHLCMNYVWQDFRLVPEKRSLQSAPRSSTLASASSSSKTLPDIKHRPKIPSSLCQETTLQEQSPSSQEGEKETSCIEAGSIDDLILDMVDVDPAENSIDSDA